MTAPRHSFVVPTAQASHLLSRTASSKETSPCPCEVGFLPNMGSLAEQGESSSRGLLLGKAGGAVHGAPGRWIVGPGSSTTTLALSSQRSAPALAVGKLAGDGWKLSASYPPPRLPPPPPPAHPDTPTVLSSCKRSQDQRAT